VSRLQPATLRRRGCRWLKNPDLQEELPLKSLRFSGRYAVVCAVILAIGLPSVAMGFGEGRTLLLGKRNPSSNAALGLSTETQIIANNSTYATRQSNKKEGDGGGAIYGCRSNTGNEACLDAQNLRSGLAFEFITAGTTGGRITTATPAGAPFTTNATGVATGLNADRVDGHEATDFASAGDLLYAVVTDPGGSAAPTLGAVRGATAVSKGASGNVYTVTFSRDVSKCSYTASPTGGAATASPGVTATAGNTSAVTVDAGATTPAGFHLQVIC
jgi:hypothetical protein